MESVTAAAMEEKAKLQKHFSRFDIFFFLICTLVGVDTLGQVASYGAQGLTWLLFLGLFFFLPYALLTAELGAAFTEEGGAYIWTRMAYGRLAAAVNAVLYWFSNPVWIGASLALLTLQTIDTFFFNVGQGGAVWYVVGFAYIWFSVWSAILSFGVGKWIPTLGAWCRMAVLGLFTITTVIYAFKHGLHVPGAGKFSPTYTLFIGLVPVLFFNYVGFELPNAAGDEMEDPQKDVPITVLRAWVTTVLMYGLPIMAIVCVLPQSKISGVGGFMDAVGVTFSVYGGAASAMTKVAAICFILALVSSACTWLMGSDRSQAVASYDGAGPRFLGKFSAKFGTPINVNFLSGILSTIVFVIATKIGNGSAARTFSVMIGVVILFTTMSYILIFPTVIRLRYTHPNVERPYRIPFGNAGAWICGVLCTLWATFATIVGLFPGFADGQFLNNADLPDKVSRTEYTTIALVATGVTIVVGLLFYVSGTKTRQSLVGTAPATPGISPMPAD